MIGWKAIMQTCRDYDAEKITKAQAIAKIGCEPWQWHELLHISRGDTAQAELERRGKEFWATIHASVGLVTISAEDAEECECLAYGASVYQENCGNIKDAKDYLDMGRRLKKAIRNAAENTSAIKDQ